MKYDVIVFKVSNINENNICQQLLFDNGYSWDNINIVRNFDEYPVYLFAESIMEIGYMDKQDLNSKSIKNYINICIINGEQICPTIFNYDDVKYIDIIKNYGYIKPTYHGKGKPIREMKNNYLYTSVVFKVSNDEENKICQKILNDKGYNYSSLNFSEYPVYLFADNRFMIIDFVYDSSLTKDHNIYDFIDKYNSWNEIICKKIYKYDDAKYIDIILKHGDNKPTYKHKKIERTLESYFSKYPYDDIIIGIYNIDELNILTKYFNFSNLQFKTFASHFIYNNNEPMYIRLDYDKNVIKYKGYSDLKDLQQLSITMPYNYEKLFTINDIKNNILTNIIKYGKSNPKPIYNPKGKPIRESVNNTLHIFDFDDTLVYSKRFEENVKHLIVKENITPTDILKIEIDKLGIKLSQLNYENGRIYINDINQNINIPSNSSWVRKKDRIYLIQPDLYYSSDESIPIGIYDKIVELYNSVNNKMILTARKEHLRNKVLSILNKFNIDIPNYGLYMFPNKSNIFSSKWKSEKILEISNKFNEIHYYDDNIKQLKKISNYLQDKNINIYYHKVTENTYKNVITN